jgi:hypothetical protein
LKKKVAKKIFGPVDEVREQFMIYNEKFSDLFRSPCVVRMVKPRRIRWAEHVARMGRQGMQTQFWWGNLLKNCHLEGEKGSGRIALSRMLGK